MSRDWRVVFLCEGLFSKQWRHTLVDEIFTASMLYVMKFDTDIGWLEQLENGL